MLSVLPFFREKLLNLWPIPKIGLFLLIFSFPTSGQGNFSQITATFPSERTFRYEYQSQDHSLNLEFDKTTPEELSAFERYDDRVIKRVIYRDLSPSGTRLKLILRDRNVKVLVQSYKEPFRVVIDLYDSDYQPTHDMKTKFPLSPSYKLENTKDSPYPKNSQNEISKSQPLSLLTNEPQPMAPKLQDSPDTWDSSRTKRQLLQPLGKTFISAEEMQSALASVPDGHSTQWSSYPPYIYRLQSATYDRRDFSGTRDRTSQSMPTLADALTSSKIMADYAGKLFDLGHENRALITYNQILQKDPNLFDQDALSLWKLAEIHLGGGNLTLARGYFETLVSKHPESALAPFSKLRILDVAAIRLLQKDRFKDLPELIGKLETIKVWNNGELSGLIAIRKAYWSNPGIEIGNRYSTIPRVKRDIYDLLSSHFPGVENSRTAFLIASILINEFCQNSYKWQRSNGLFAEEYFKRFSGPNIEAIQRPLREKLFAKLNSNIQQKVSSGNLIDAIEDFENLPKSMQSIRKNSQTSWALAESYRKLSHQEKSIGLYRDAADSVPEGSIDRLKSEFWVAYLSISESKNRASSKNATVSKSLEKQSKTYDARMGQTWNRLSPKDKDAISVAYKEHFERSITENAKLRTAALIVLTNWTAKLSAKASTSTTLEQGVNGLDKSYSPSSSALYLLNDLSKLFSSLGMLKEKREANLLLKQMKPSDFADDQAAKKIWTDQLIKLAEEYRKSNQYLDAGRLFGFVGENSENSEKRAEILYKSGLLLFRAGRKQDAVNSFQKAADDGNNLFYANLAKERLTQIQ